MDKIKKYIEHFFKSKKIDRHYALTTFEMIVFMQEMSDANKMFYSITTLFRYGYIKGYRAVMVEMKKGGAVNG